MKIIVDVEVSNRLSASYSMPKARSRRSSLSLGTKQGKPEELVIIHQSNQNVGTEYKVKGNVERVFDRYLMEGKMTIRFINPPHDLIIKGDVVLLERFTKGLKLGLQKNVSVKAMKLPTASYDIMKKVPPKPKKRLAYHSKAEYPFLEGFPRTAVAIVINSVEQKQLDMRLLGLPCLQELDLTNNNLTMLPAEIDLLPQLRTLHLSDNNFGAGTRTSWAWLKGDNVVQKLETLDLSHNGLQFLPPAICYLKALKTLKVSDNKIKSLPGAIGILSQLQTLTASNNQIECLPGSLAMLKLWVLDLSSNPFVFALRGAEDAQCKMPTLKEWAARSVTDNRIRFAPTDLPREVQYYLDSVSFCQCQHACFEAGIHACSELLLSSVAQSVIRTFSDVPDVPVQLSLCSYKCVLAFNKGGDPR